MLFLYLALFFVLLIYYFTKTRRALHMLQLNHYNENQRYLKWVMKHPKQAFYHLDLGGVILLLLPFVTNDILRNIILIVMIGFYLFAEYTLLLLAKTDQNKTPLVTTSRIKRLWVPLFLFFMIPVVIGFLFHDLLPWMLFLDVMFCIFCYFLVYLANIINIPAEKMVFHYYASKAKRKLSEMKNLKVIGITGSYGKTSSKNILNDILSVKYITRPSPKNYNTYYGLMITVNNYLDKFDDVLIAEMGAYARGDIKGLCNLVHPKYGILTKIGTAHLESFGSEENILKTKFELIESLPSDGVAVLNRDDEKQVSYPLQNKVKTIWIGIMNQDADLVATNIRCSGQGTWFELKLKGQKETYPFETCLLGKGNVYNILAGIALGLEFGVTIPELQMAVRKVRPVDNRLELKKLGDMYQIADAYNSNPDGAKMALEVLDMMPGTKVVVTPGMIELGKKGREANYQFGVQINEVADYVILIGEQQTLPIKEGLLESGYDPKKIHVLNDVRASYPLVLKLKGKEDIYALYENDLPDSYVE